MSYTRRIVSVRLAPFMAVTCGFLLVGLSLSPQALAQRSPKSRVQRSEYCAIVGAHSDGFGIKKEKYKGVATICYFRSSGCRREEVSFELVYADFLKEGADANQFYNTYAARMRAEESALSKAITKLGDDGWEMVGENRIDFSSAVDTNTRAIYFKRRSSH